MRTVVAALLAAVSALAGAAGASADAGHDDARAQARCGTAEVELEVGREDAGLEVELEAERVPERQAWRVVILHERSVVFRGVRRGTGFNRAFRVRRVVRDWPGRETLTARMTTPSGRSCRLAVTV